MEEGFPILFAGLMTAVIAWVTFGTIGVGGAPLVVIVVVAFLGSMWLMARTG